MTEVRTTKTATEQVRIRQDIAQAVSEFYRINQRAPNVLYIGYQDFYNLCRECQPWEINLDANGRSYEGMKIYRVDIDFHINVAWSDSRAI